MPEFIGLLLLAGILSVIGVFWVERFRLGATALLIILASAVLFRVVLLPARSTPSDDVYRYQWDGRAQRAHLNPYVVFPNSEELDWLQNPEHSEPPGEETPTFYPPAERNSIIPPPPQPEPAPRRSALATVLDGYLNYCAFIDPCEPSAPIGHSKFFQTLLSQAPYWRR